MNVNERAIAPPGAEGVEGEEGAAGFASAPGATICGRHMSGIARISRVVGVVPVVHRNPRHEALSRTELRA